MCVCVFKAPRNIQNNAFTLESARSDSASAEKAESDATAQSGRFSNTRTICDVRVTCGRQGNRAMLAGSYRPPSVIHPSPKPLVFLGRRVGVMVVQCGT